MGVPQDQLSTRLQPFERLQQYANLQKPPVIKFKDLEAAVNSKITYNILPMRVRVDYVRMTNSSVLTNITLLFERSDLTVGGQPAIQRTFLQSHPEILATLERTHLRLITSGELLKRGYRAYWARDLTAARAIFRQVMRRGYGKPLDWKYMLPALLPEPWHHWLIRKFEN